VNKRYAFQHTFLRGVTCSMVFEPAIHYNRATQVLRPAKLWSREPTDEEFRTFYPQYVEWMHTVNLQLSEVIGGDHTYIFQDGHADEPFWEFWVYHANGEKECVAKETGFFDQSRLGR
jgi:hypothetical protein